MGGSFYHQNEKDDLTSRVSWTLAFPMSGEATWMMALMPEVLVYIVTVSLELHENHTPLSASVRSPLMRSST